MQESLVRMAEIVMPNDTNPQGTLSGGSLMHMIDIAGAMSAMRHARSKVVTVAIDDVTFRAPVPVGFILELMAQVTCVGRTSMEVKVESMAENPLTGGRCHTTTAHLVFVAVDQGGRPQAVPGLEAQTAEEKALQARALQRRAKRLQEL
ncbi:MAG: acyl-CoA thioesterase [Acidobacteriota bacterium]